MKTEEQRRLQEIAARLEAIEKYLTRRAAESKRRLAVWRRH